MKRTNQQGVCKIAVFAYDRMSGRPVWQSGNRKVASRAKDIWVMGAGPFQRGTIYDGTAFAGERFAVPLVAQDEKQEDVQKPDTSVGARKGLHPTKPRLPPRSDSSASAAMPTTWHRRRHSGAATNRARNGRAGYRIGSAARLDAGQSTRRRIRRCRITAAEGGLHSATAPAGRAAAASAAPPRVRKAT